MLANQKSIKRITSNMFEIKATSKGIPPETYIVEGQAEARKLALELLDRQYIVEVSELEPED